MESASPKNAMISGRKTTEYCEVTIKLGLVPQGFHDF